MSSATPNTTRKRTGPEGTGCPNRRRHCRYGFITDLTYEILSHDSVLLRGRGRTVDMSAGGMLLELDRVVMPGSNLQLSLIWPGVFHGTGPLLLHVRGCVVRRAGGRAAIRIVNSEFRTASDLPVRPVRLRVAGNRREVA
jgi:hypothetical protein